MSTLRRYELLLPLEFNDGTPVPDRLIGEVQIELRQRFGAVSLETQVIQGLREHGDTVYRDRLARLFVDVPDLPEHREFFIAYKRRLMERFQQLDLWITSHPIDNL